MPMPSSDWGAVFTEDHAIIDAVSTSSETDSILCSVHYGLSTDDPGPLSVVVVHGSHSVQCLFLIKITSSSILQHVWYFFRSYI